MKGLISLGILAAGPAWAAGWTQPEGDYYGRVVNRILVGEKGYDRHGKSQDTGGSYTDWQLVAYGEYGLTDEVTLVALITPLGYAAFEDEGRAADPDRLAASAFYLGPLSFGARYGRPVGPLRLAVEGRYGYAPAVGETVARGSFACESGPCERFAYTPALEHHRFDGELQVGAGLPWGLWVAAGGGVRGFLGTDWDPAAIGFGQLGWSGPWGLVAEIHLTLNRTLGDLDDNQIAGTGETRYLGRGLGLSWWFSDHVAITAGMDGATGVRSNAATASRVIGIEIR